MEFEKKRMVNWYDVRQLASTGLKTMISGIFGNFADKREMEAALSPEASYYDASGKNDVWVDYVSDLGDGFDSTYTVAHLLARPTLDHTDGKTKLQQGDILVMGGDAVYPTPEAAEYANRLQGPYNAAFPWIPHASGAAAPCVPNPYTKKLFVLPGNHDWYDGLGNFIKLFCQKRSLGRWLTEQDRSYFAVRLPHKHWLIGIDVQLNADIDKPQMDYFREILAKKEFEEGSRVILCTAEPSWVYKSWDDKNKSHARIQFFIDRILYGDECCPYYEKNKTLRIAAILTGDLHHYSRYEQILDENGARRTTQLITAGGGGAFTHPTHFLKDEISLGDAKKTGWMGKASATRKASFPTASQSRGLAWWNLLFPVLSPHMLLFLGGFHLFTIWCLQAGSASDETFLDQVARVGNSSEFVDLICRHVKFSPTVVFLNVILVAGLYNFTDITTGKKTVNRIVGGLHGLVQLAVFYVAIWVLVGLNAQVFELAGVVQKGLRSTLQIVLFSVEMCIIGGAAAAFVFGLYLLFSTRVLENHATEAFSSFRWTGYKNFLRIHITQSKTTVYAVGIQKVVTQWEEQADPYASRFKPKTEIQYTLIDEIELKP